MPDAPVRPTLAASAAVFRDGRVLLARRGRAPAAGIWSLPGGRVEPGEPLAVAAAREVMEEVGVAAQVIGVAGALDIIRHHPSGELQAHFVVIAHAARWQAGEPATGPEAEGVGWFAPDVLPAPATDGLAGIVAAAHALVRAAADGEG